MNEYQLTDRVVVEVHGEECTLEQMAASLRAVAEMIEQGRKGGEFPIGNKGDLLWERECTDYGFRILSDKSLICQYYYGSEPKPKILPDGEHVVASINKQDLIDFGFDGDSILDDDIAIVASRMGKAYHEGYCDCWGEDLRSAAEYIGLKEKED